MNPIINSDLAKYLAQIIFNRLLGKMQLVRDDAVTSTLSDIFANLRFSLVQVVLHV